MLRWLSVAAFVAMVAGLVGLFYFGALFASRPPVIAIQVAAFLLMVAAIMIGAPYAYVRHPIYAAIIYFIWAGALDHFSWRVLAYAGLITAGALTRMHIEEYLLVRRYPEYRPYKARVRRIVLYVF